MDDSGESIDKFAAILQQHTIEKPKSVYKDVNLGNRSVNSTVKARDVIFNVAKQIRAIQSGQRQAGFKSKTSCPNTSKPHESSLVPVNMLQRKIVPLNQLLTADQTDEVACIGVTQEFDMAFDQEEFAELPNVNVEDRQNTAFQIIDISLKEPDADKVSELPIRNESFKSKLESQFDNCTQILNECIEIENIDQIDVFNEDTVPDDILTQNPQNRSPSPIFSVKSSKRKSKPSSPLVYDLECFENFENIATSIVDDSMDNNIAKQLINSQIFGKELYLNSKESPSITVKERTSPVIQLNTDSFKVDSNLLLEMRKTYNDRQSNGDQTNSERKEPSHKGPETNKQIEIVEFEDEILFSSDEEDEHSYKSVKDLPFTCALETSFYDEESDILDKTMFVGFQTASNKSILVKTDSFSKAKNILDEVDGSLQSSTSTVTDLVQFKDKNNSDKITSIVGKNDVNIVKASNHGEETTIDQNVDISSQPKTHIFEVLDPKDKHTASRTQITETANSENISDSVAKELLLENDCPDAIPNATSVLITNSSHEDIAKSQQDTEDIHKLDDEMVLEFQDEMMYKDLKTETIDNEALGIQSELNKNGFKTASNKKILISTAALEKSKSTMQNIDLDLNDNDMLETFKISNLEANTINVGFSTASNKKNEISDKALTRIKSVFHDINLGKLTKNNLDFEDPIASTSTCGFKTAANKEIKISKEALNEAKSVLRDIDKHISDQTLVNDEIDLNHSTNHKKVVENNIIPDEDTSGSDNEPPFYGFDHSSEDESLLQEFLHRSQKVFKKLDGCSTKTISEDQTKTQAEVANHFDKVQGKVLDKTKECSSNKLVKTDAFEGFKTASNKNIIISGKALERSRKLFQDFEKQISDECHSQEKLVTHGKRIQEYSETDGPLAKKQKTSNDFTNKRQKYLPFSGFQTASKPIQVAEESLEKSPRLFQVINHEISPVKVPEFKGFQTASNKIIKVSEQALKKSKSLFADIDDNMAATAAKSKTPNFTELQPSSKIQVKIQVKTSEHAPEGSRKLLNLHKDTTLSENADMIECQGVLTASNKPLTISEKSLDKSRKIFQNVDDDHVKSSARDVGKLVAFSGFQTASNIDIKISAKSLEKGRKLLQDLAGVTESNPKSKDAVKMFQGFQTASNKKVEISEKALEKSRKLFQDFDSDTFVESDSKKLDEIPKFNGFQTVSNKTVRISDRALEISRNMFQDLDACTDSNQKQFDDIPKLKYTASNKEVKITDQALEKSKKMLNDEKFTENSQEFSRWGGFQTGNNKKVKVSETALARTRKIFQNLTGCEESDSPNFDDTKPKFGFHTANNNKIDVSKDALLKSKELVRNLDENKTASKTKHLNEEPIHNEAFEINTEVINDFETTFKEATPKNDDMTPKKSKRSGSPILSCPKAKKRKVFKIPYSQKTIQKEPHEQPIFKPPNIEVDCRQNAFTFSSNYKKIKKYTLKDLKKMDATSASDKRIDQYISNFDYENILSFEFFGKRNDITDSKQNITDLKNQFLNSVNRKLIPEGWIDIQLKLIIWKLISYEITFPKTMHLTCTARNVIDQLKFRYDKELYDAERPILRKIMERDEISTRMLVLCVVEVSGGDDSSLPPELTLTDGWYTIKALTDKMLSKFVSNGKITVGTKLLTHGAELVGSGQAVSPWEDTSSIRLKLFGNSTRRARWDARLGCYGNAAILSHLSDVAVEGGKVPRVRVLVTRVYPPLYVDRFEDGSTVTRSERLEHLHQMKYEAERQLVLDKIYEEVEKEVDQDSEDSESSGCSSRQQGRPGTEARLNKVMKLTDTQFSSQLTATQKRCLEEYKEKRREKIMSAIQSKVQDKMAAYGMNLNRNVVTVCKVRVVDIKEKRGSVAVTKAMLSIWRPNEAVTEVIKENSWIEVLNVTPTAFRYAELQLSAGRQSIFVQSKHKENDKLQPYTLSLKRTCYPIKDLVKNPTMATDYNEIDTIGVVFQTDPTTKDFDTSKQPFQNVYLADIDQNIICINFWGGLRKFGFENCLDTGQVIAGINLQKRAGNTRKSIPQYRVTELSYFTKTPKQDIARKIIEELSLALSKIDKKAFIEECIRLKDNHSLRGQANENTLPYRFSNIDMNSSKTKMFLNTPLAQKLNERDDIVHLTGLDFESTFKQQDTQEFSPKILFRKGQVQQKLAKLKMYGEPPALSPLQIVNKSKDAAKAYKSPLFSKSDVSISVANKEESIQNQQSVSKREECDKIDCSPVICLNRTYVKKCDVRPVKLNICKNDESCTDGFAEDFDCSPPLSLD